MRETAGSIGVGAVLARKYKLVRVLGEGASGRVFEAVHEKTAGRCAIKLLHAGADASERERMRNEARALAKLDHRGIVRLLDYDELEDGASFIVQELVEGRTLRAVLDDELLLAAPRAVSIAIALLDALAYAHERGVVHRDIKPENIVLAQGADGTITPKLVDFGLVRELDAGADRARSNLTRPGAIAGTPRYMSPEQAWGRADIDARTDLWSIGVVLYEALSGAAPYDGANDREVLASIVAREPVHLRSVGVAVDDALADVVMQALVRAPEGRIATARMFADALLACANPTARAEPAAPVAAASRDSVAPVAPAPARRAVLSLGAASLLAAVVAGVAATRGDGLPSSAPARAGSVAITAPDVLAPVDSLADAAADIEDSAVSPVIRRNNVIVAPARRYDSGARASSNGAASGRGANASPIIDEL